MAELTRSEFMKRASVSAAAVGALTVPGFASVQQIAEAHAVSSSTTPIMAHIRNASAGEVAVYVGEREIIVTDHVLVRRLLKAAE